MRWNLKTKEFVNFLLKPESLLIFTSYLLSWGIWGESLCFRLMDLAVRLMEIWSTFLLDEDICFSPPMQGMNIVFL